MRRRALRRARARDEPACDGACAGGILLRGRVGGRDRRAVRRRRPLLSVAGARRCPVRARPACTRRPSASRTFASRSALPGRATAGKPFPHETEPAGVSAVCPRPLQRRRGTRRIPRARARARRATRASRRRRRRASAVRRPGRPHLPDRLVGVDPGARRLLLDPRGRRRPRARRARDNASGRATRCCRASPAIGAPAGSSTSAPPGATDGEVRRVGPREPTARRAARRLPVLLVPGPAADARRPDAVRRRDALPAGSAHAARRRGLLHRRRRAWRTITQRTGMRACEPGYWCEHGGRRPLPRRPRRRRHALHSPDCSGFCPARPRVRRGASPAPCATEPPCARGAATCTLRGPGYDSAAGYGVGFRRVTQARARGAPSHPGDPVAYERRRPVAVRAHEGGPACRRRRIVLATVLELLARHHASRAARR